MVNRAENDKGNVGRNLKNNSVFGVFMAEESHPFPLYTSLTDYVETGVHIGSVLKETRQSAKNTTHIVRDV